MICETCKCRQALPENPECGPCDRKTVISDLLDALGVTIGFALVAVAIILWGAP